MSLFIKICGMTDEAAVSEALTSEVDAIGFVFAESPRQLSLDRANRLAEPARGHTKLVAVFRCPKPHEISRIVDGFVPDLIQCDIECVGATDHPALPVVRPRSRSLVPTVFDSPIVCEGPNSGEGELVDLDFARSLSSAGPIVLAGGLTPQNVAKVVAEVRPHGVDVSSGVEVTRGFKDPALIRLFVANARKAQERLISL